MSYTDLTSRINTDLSAVTGIGKVYSLKKNAHDEHTKSSLFKNSGILHAWFIYRDGIDTSQDMTTLVTRKHQFVIEGYYAHKTSTSTESTLEALVDSICDKFAGDRKLGGYGYMVTAPNAPVIDEVMFCDVLCDHAEIRFEVITPHSGGTS